MKAIVQRVSKAKVTVDGKTTGEIGKGLLVLLGITETDDEKIMQWISRKLVNLRIFNDEDDKKNISLLDIDGGLLIVSNFTVYGEIRKGSRPNFGKAAPADMAEKLYDKMISHIKDNYPVNVQTGVFGAMMKIDLVNDGPVTLVVEKEKNQ